MPKTSGAPSREILEAALQALQAQKQRLEDQISEVQGLLGGRSAPSPQPRKSQSSNSGGSQQRKQRVLSPEARKRIAAAQKKRWAAFRKNQG